MRCAAPRGHDIVDQSMRRLFLPLLAAGLLLMQPAAEARDFRPGAGPRLQAQEQPRNRGNGAQRSERKQRADPEQRKPGRLTQEERRELHRDLDRANREIYRR
jgi:hypothetical protein